MDPLAKANNEGANPLVAAESSAADQQSAVNTARPSSSLVAADTRKNGETLMEGAFVSPFAADSATNENRPRTEGTTEKTVEAPREAAAQQDNIHRQQQLPEVSISSSPSSPFYSTKAVTQAGVVAKRASRSGRQAIRTTNTRSAAEGTLSGMLVPISLNGQYKTIPEEHAEFRARNKVRANYHGPVYTVEDVFVPCHACGGPVDPVARVPVGSLFFHVSCLQCYLCGRRGGVAGLFLQVDRQAVCSECAARRYERWVPRQEAQSRGMIYGAIQGDVYAAMDAHDRGERNLPRLVNASQWASRKSHAAVAAAAPVAGASTLNRPTVPGALPPSLAIRPVHNARNTGRRSFALMERQQYYTQSDNNLLMRIPELEAVTGGSGTAGGARRVSKSGKWKSGVSDAETGCITAGKNAT